MFCDQNREEAAWQEAKRAGQLDARESEMNKRHQLWHDRVSAQLDILAQREAAVTLRESSLCATIC